MIYYSPLQGGFYFAERGDDIPDGSVSVSQSVYDALFAGHLAGHMIVPNKDGFPVLETPSPPPPAPVPQSITRRQCAKQLLAMGLITAADALAMTKTGDAPALVLNLLNTLPASTRIDAQIDFAADTYERINPLLNQLMTAMGKTAEDCDLFFRDAALL